MLNPYLLGGVAAAFLAVLGFAGCEHHNAKAARADRDTAISERDQARADNRSNMVTISDQTKALAAWKALHATPDEVAAIVANANQYVTEIDRLSRQVRMYREKDKALPECVRLMAIAYSTCPGRVAVLLDYADGRDSHRRSADSRSRSDP